MSGGAREVLEKFNAVDLSGLEFPLDGDSTTIYNSDKEEITIPYWRVAELLNEVKVAQDMAKAALAEPLRNCDIGTAEEQGERFIRFCCRNSFRGVCNDSCKFVNVNRRLGWQKIGQARCFPFWAQVPYEEGGAK
jgi:hypothetical protein